MAQDITKKRLFVGKVISDKMDKTIVVQISRTLQDPAQGKVIRRTSTYKVHDDLNEARMGDTVSFYEGRKLSKTKYMYLYKRVHVNQ